MLLDTTHSYTNVKGIVYVYKLLEYETVDTITATDTITVWWADPLEQNEGDAQIDTFDVFQEAGYGYVWLYPEYEAGLWLGGRLEYEVVE